MGSTGSAVAAGPVALSAVEPQVAARHGVVVLAAAGTAADLAWPIAQAVYGDEGLRPKIVDAEARVLAGEAPKEGATAHVRELAELRAQVKGDDAASRAMLADVARRTGARAVAVVLVADGAAEVRLWDAAGDQLEGTRYRREASGWSPFASTLHTRFAPPPPPKSLPGPEKNEKKKTGSFYENPWFWAAVGSAALAGVVVYAVTRDDGTPAPVLVRW